MKTAKIEEFLDEYLDENSFDDLLEYLDITPYEAFECLFNNGLIDEETLEELYGWT